MARRAVSIGLGEWATVALGEKPPLHVSETGDAHEIEDNVQGIQPLLAGAVILARGLCLVSQWCEVSSSDFHHRHGYRARSVLGDFLDCPGLSRMRSPLG